MANQTAVKPQKDINPAFTVQLKDGRKLRVLPADNGIENDAETVVDTPVTEAKTNGAVGGKQPVEQQTKNGGYGMESKPVEVEIELGGPTSFEELDAIDRAYEKQSMLTILVHKFKQITENVLNSFRMTPEEKVNAINDVSGELRQRLADAMVDDPRETKATAVSDIDYVIANPPFASSKVSKTDGGVEYQASDYADVPDPEKPSTWKLLLAEGSSGNFTVAQVARAITAMQPSGFRGNQVTLGQPRSTVVSKISGVIGRLDATQDQKDNLRKRLNAVKALRSGFKVVKSKDGRDRWLGWVTNNFLDRDGEILTEKAHKEFIEYLDANPDEAPELWTFHIKGTARQKKADFWGYVNGFVVMGGELTPQEAKAFNELGDTLDLAMSHGFFVFTKSGNEIGRYRTFEVSVLPRDEAANPWTDFATVYEVNSMSNLTAKQRDLAVKLHGEDFVRDLEESTKDRSELLKALGFQQKAQSEEVVNEQAETVTETAPAAQTAVQAQPVQGSEEQEEADTEKSVGTATLDEITKAVIKGLNLEGLAQAIKAQNEQINESIKQINGRLDALETDTDEKMEKMLTPRAASFDWSGVFRPSQSKETQIEKGSKDEESFADKKPEYDWIGNTFAQATNGNGR